MKPITIINSSLDIDKKRSHFNMNKQKEALSSVHTGFSQYESKLYWN